MSIFIISLNPYVRLKELCLFLRKCALQVLWNFSCFPRTIKKIYMNYKQFSGSLFQSSRMYVSYLGLWLKNAKFKYNCCLTFSLKREYIPWCEYFICLFPKHRTKIFTEHSLLIDHANTSVQTLFFWVFFFVCVYRSSSSKHHFCVF